MPSFMLVSLIICHGIFAAIALHFNARLERLGTLDVDAWDGAYCVYIEVSMGLYTSRSCSHSMMAGLIPHFYIYMIFFEYGGMDNGRKVFLAYRCLMFRLCGR